MVYVIAQLVCLTLIIWPVEQITFSLIGFLIMLIALVVVIFVFMANPLYNFNVHPMPKKTGALIVHGPYRFIRHPMYTSLCLATLGLLLFQFTIWKLVMWCLLILILVLKARFEEKLLCLHHPGYVDYQKTNKAFIPWIY